MLQQNFVRRGRGGSADHDRTQRANAVPSCKGMSRDAARMTRFVPGPHRPLSGITSSHTDSNNFGVVAAKLAHYIRSNRMLDLHRAAVRKR